ncbi:MAG: hypothetical protein ACQKBV_01340 [Puniceicoccales bacterium]
MEENVPLPRINKIPFIVFDVLLVLTALIVGFSSGGPLSPMMFFLVIFCVALGCGVACMPFYVEFRTLAKLKEYDLSQANHENARRIEAAMLAIQEIGENIVQNTDREAEIASAFETLLERMEGRIGEMNGGESAPAGVDSEQLREALATVRDDFAQSIAEQVAMSGDKQHEKLNAALSKLQGLPMQVTLLGELAGRYQSLAAMISDTAANLITATPSTETSTKPTSEPEEELAEEDDASEEAVAHEEVESEEESADADADAEDEVEESEEAEDDADSGDESEPEEESETEEEIESEEDAESDEELEAESDEELEAEEVDEEPAEAESAEEESEESEETVGEVIAEAIAEDLEEEDEASEYDEESTDDVPEFLGPDELEDEPAHAEDIEPIDHDEASAEESAPEADDDGMGELDDEEDFDVAMSGAIDEVDSPEAAAAKAEDAEESDAEETESEDAEASGMGFEDWDDFGEIAASGDDDESEEEPADQPDLMDDLPPSEPRSKPKKPKGATTLIAQVLIGIGNKPYVRGTGPGLSEDEGVPMEFLEIGKWQWVAPDSDEPVTVRIYKNDEIPAEGDPVEIPAGQRRSVAPKFTS